MSDTALRLAERIDFTSVHCGHEAAAELRRLVAENEALLAETRTLVRQNGEWRNIHDAVVKDSDKAHALLRLAEAEMRHAGWGTRSNDRSVRNDVYEAIVEFLK